MMGDSIATNTLYASAFADFKKGWFAGATRIAVQAIRANGNGYLSSTLGFDWGRVLPSTWPRLRNLIDSKQQQIRGSTCRQNLD